MRSTLAGGVGGVGGACRAPPSVATCGTVTGAGTGAVTLAGAGAGAGAGRDRGDEWVPRATFTAGGARGAEGG